MKEQIYNSLMNKNIILFGVQEDTVKFYQKYHHLIHIRFCVTSYTENLDLQPMQEYGLETVLYDDVTLTDDDFLVICDDMLYRSIDHRLQTERIVEYEQFVSWKLAAAVLERKKIVLFMGTALVGQLAMSLNMQPDFINKYYSVYYPEDAILSPYKNRMNEYRHLARMCDAYIISACDKDRYGSKVFTDKLLKSDCVKISISDYSFNGYYPQIVNDRDYISDYLYREKERLPMLYDTLFMAREDKNLRAYIEKQMPEDEIINLVCDDSFYSERYVLECFNQALENVKRADLKADVKLADYIAGNADVVLYRNLDEWNISLLLYVTEIICGKLQIIFQDPNMNDIVEKLESSSGSELPVYPSVLKWLHTVGYENKKYRIVSYYGASYMGFEDYMRHCIKSMYQIKEMNQFLDGGAV